MLHKKRKPSTFTSSDDAVDCNCSIANNNNNMLHSKSTYFYRWFGSLRTGTYLVPTMCGLALLLGLGFTLNPVIDNVDKASAATTDIITDNNLGTKVDLIMGDVVNSSETVEPGKTAYIGNSFSIKVEGKAGYHISIQANKEHGSELVGRKHGEKILGVGTNVSPDKFSDNTWGYALEDITYNSTQKESLIYNSLPAYGTLTAPQYSKENIWNSTNSFNLYFAAKITSYKPSDHYETEALLSIVAEPKEVPKNSFGGVGKMSEVTTEICKNAGTTPSATAALADVPTGQLLDDRADANGQKYWVAKLADGNCWMTQNMAHDANTTSTSNKNKIVEPGKTSATDVSSKAPSDDPLTTEVFPTSETYNAHYLIGNYYIQSKTPTVCSSLGGDWKAPTSNNSSNGSFAYLLTKTYSVGSDWAKVKAAPLYFVAGGGSGRGYVGQYGYYCSSSLSNGYCYTLNFGNGFVDTNSAASANNYGYSIRCLVSGE